MRLLRVELTRLRWRRAVVVLLVALPASCPLRPARRLRRGAPGRLATPTSPRPSELAASEAEPAVGRSEEIARCEERPRDVPRRPARDASECADDDDADATRTTSTAQHARPSRRCAPTSGTARRHASWPALLMLVGTTFAGARLEHRLDEQPAALRAAATAGVGGQGRSRSLLRRRCRRRGRAGGLLGAVGVARSREPRHRGRAGLVGDRAWRPGARGCSLVAAARAARATRSPCCSAAPWPPSALMFGVAVAGTLRRRWLPLGDGASAGCCPPTAWPSCSATATDVLRRLSLRLLRRRGDGVRRRAASGPSDAGRRRRRTSAVLVVVVVAAVAVVVPPPRRALSDLPADA